MAHRVLVVLWSLSSFGISAGASSVSTTDCGEKCCFRLHGGASRCQGEVQVQPRGLNWTGVNSKYSHLGWANQVCAELDCGSALSTFMSQKDESHKVLVFRPDHQENSLQDGFLSVSSYSHDSLELNCSDSVRLVSGSGLCSGSLQIHWDQSWTSVCEGDLDLQDAEVVCRQLGCGAPSLLQGALSGEDQVLLGQTFHCEGHESALMDCPSSNSGTCSSGKVVNLTCSEPARFVGGASRCAGILELRYGGVWRPVFFGDQYDPQDFAAVCQHLNCGDVISAKTRRDRADPPDRRTHHKWLVRRKCFKTSGLIDCVQPYLPSVILYAVDVVCEDLLNRPTVSLSVPADGASEAWAQGVRVLLGSDFSVLCSVEPQYPGGFFQLISPTTDAAQNLTLPAVNHSAHFLFSDAGPAHKGGYTCLYHLHVFNHSFSSQSHTLQLSLGASDFQLIIRVLLILLLKLIYIPALYCYCKATRGRQRNRHLD